MDRYIIESSHTAAECVRLLDEVLAIGFLHHFEWGCRAGDHTGWALIEAESEAQARLAVPPMVRAKARVVRLNSFSAEQVRGFHAGERG